MIWCVLGVLACVGLMCYIVGTGMRRPYECDPEEIIVHDDDIYIPMYQDCFGRFYYGEFWKSDATGKLHQRRFTAGSDYIRYSKLMKRIDRRSWTDRSIDKEQANVERAKSIYEEATR